MATHKYNPENDAKFAKHLTHPLRRLFLSPERMFGEIGNRNDDVWADIGCGNGFFTLPLARRTSKVFAVDISPEMLELLRHNLERGNVGNVQILLSEENVIPLSLEAVNGVFLGFVAHELNDPDLLISEASKCLKPGGKLIIVEFARKLSLGPPMNERIRPEEADLWASQAGLMKGRVWRWGRSTIGLEYTKKVESDHLN